MPRPSRLLAALAVLAASAPLAPVALAGPRDSVVRVTATQRFPSPIRPWSKQAPIESAGTGVVVEADGPKVLTCAHVVMYGSRVQVQGDDDADRAAARLVAVDLTSDLALLRLEDDAFFESHKPLPRGKRVPAPGSGVDILGFPEGGDRLAVTRGVISRVEYDESGHGLWVQVDAAVNPGNSGGPAVVLGQLVGLVRGRLDPIQAENVGYIVPLPEIELFLADAADGRVAPSPGFNAYVQALENPAFRERLGLDPAVTGVVVTRVDAGGPAGLLEPDDVLTRVGDHPIANDGSVRLDNNLRVGFTSIVRRLPAEADRVPMAVWRRGELRTIDVPVDRSPGLRPPYDGRYPPYFVYGPLVLADAYADAIPTYLRNRPDLLQMHTPLRERQQATADPDERLVVVTSPLLPSELNKGYEPMDAFGRVVADVDGVRVRNLRHLVEVLRDGTDPFVTFRFAETPGLVLVYRRDQLLDATPKLLEENDIPRQGSDDILALWKSTRETQVHAPPP
jgi:S1-C subfamily serine protease